MFDMERNVLQYLPTFFKRLDPFGLVSLSLVSSLVRRWMDARIEYAIFVVQFLLIEHC